MIYIEKDKDAVLDYTLDWEPWLSSDTISTSVWIVPTGITNDSDSNDTTNALIWLSGGTLYSRYVIVNRITTAAGRTDDRTITVTIVEK